MKITIDQIRAEAEKIVSAPDGWKEKEARLRALGWSEEKLEKARSRHLKAVAFNRDFAEKILKRKPEMLLAPASHGGDLDKTLWDQAAKAWFGFEAEVDWPHHQMISQR